MRGARLAAAIGVLLCVAAGCRSLPGGRFIAGMATGDYRSDAMTQQELRLALMQYASRFEATIVAAADTISANTQDPVIQRRTLRWKLGITPVVNQAAFLSEPEAAYVAMLTVATAMQEFLTTGGGTDAFGEQQSLAVEASNDLLAAAVELGDRFLSAKELKKVMQDVQNLVRSQPIRGEFVAEQVQTLVTTTEASPLFDWVTAIPLSPFRAMQGVDAGAQAIREFNDTAMEMSRIIASMPRLMRWNIELMTLNITHQGDIVATLESFQQAALSAEQLSLSVQALPEDMRLLLAEAQRSGRTLTPLAQSLENSAKAVAEAGNAWGALVASLNRPPADPSQPSRPFDIREWQQTATQIGTAALELRALLESAGTLADSQTLAGPLADLEARVARVEAGSRALVNLAALRAFQLILAFFVLLFVYRRIERWLGSRAAAR